ncbi:hypothetical protein HNR00_001761 [Methylorubrum rhodinum]|uniref:Uncharacterized protein n=1 Tax=Methylorubrum rhodinum TaxID=29428 RepID=A0A840ZJN8_9HYPH|nr:hypothetical protein [Methylorubrum rhodinum]
MRAAIFSLPGSGIDGVGTGRVPLAVTKDQS